jgi:hypothetical protein
MVDWSNTTATSFMRPQPLSHLSASILDVHLRSCANRMRFLLRGFCFLNEEPANHPRQA